MRNALFVGLGILALGGCKPAYEGLYIRAQSQEYGGRVSGDFMDLPEGIAIAAVVEIQSANNQDFSLTDLDLDGRDSRVADVQRGDYLGRYVFYGIMPGNTCVEVRIDGDLEECIDVTVTAQ